MSDPFVDTNVLIRLLTGDDPVKQEGSARLFAKVQAGELVLTAPDTVIADAVFVLSSPRLYKLPRAKIQELLTPLLRLLGFRVRNRRALIKALDLYAATNLDFGDAFIAASMSQVSSEVLYSYDEDFDRLPSILRVEP
jgi:predicted nucleic acid-binding protein